jgi:hypothetical protein
MPSQDEIEEAAAIFMQGYRAALGVIQEEVERTVQDNLVRAEPGDRCATA